MIGGESGIYISHVKGLRLFKALEHTPFMANLVTMQ